MKAIVAGLVLVLGGCAGMHVGAPADDEPTAEDFDPRVRAVTAKYFPLMIVPKCDDGTDRPGTRIAHVQGMDIPQSCGLVTTTMEIEDYRAYVARHCQGTQSAQCTSAYGGMYAARVQERYPYADERAIDAHCKAYPDQCSTMLLIELAYVESHNKVVHEFWRSGTDLAVAEAELEQTRERQRSSAIIGSALQGLGASMQQAAQQPQRVSCTSNSYGGTTQTSCY